MIEAHSSGDDPVYVIGHRNPDTDAVCSALAYAELLQQTVHPTAVAACCGVTNLRTDFVLETAGVKPPRLLLDVSPTAYQISQHKVVSCTEDETFFNVYQKMKARNLRTIPVKSKDGKLVGILSLLDVLNLVFEGQTTSERTRQVRTSLNNICKVLGGSFQDENASDPETIEDLVVTVGAMSAGGFKSRLEKMSPEGLIVVAGDRPTIQLPAIEHGVRAIVVTGGYELSEGLMMVARDRGVAVLQSPHETATTTMLIKSARMIEPAIQRDCVTIGPQKTLDQVRQLVHANPQDLYPVAGVDKKLRGVLSKTDLVAPTRTRIVMVDHNEWGQAVKGAEEANVLEVLDHHRLGGGLRSHSPIRFINEVVGSTCTIVAMQYRMRGLEPSRGMAICMIAGLMSDTLGLTSPTTTDTDREILEWLTPYSGLDPVEFANDFFAAGSSLRAKSAEDVIQVDCKEFEESGQRFSVSQIEEIGLDRFWKRKQELTSALNSMQETEELSFSCLLITDISRGSSLLMVSGQNEFLKSLPFPKRGEGLFTLDGVVSRKKQFIPMISALLGSD